MNLNPVVGTRGPDVFEELQNALTRLREEFYDEFLVTPDTVSVGMHFVAALKRNSVSMYWAGYKVTSRQGNYYQADLIQLPDLYEHMKIFCSRPKDPLERLADIKGRAT